MRKCLRSRLKLSTQRYLAAQVLLLSLLLLLLLLLLCSELVLQSSEHMSKFNGRIL
jgi:uncharacterized protein YebE (UPF0316 family)